jgi:hypothetical protein
MYHEDLEARKRHEELEARKRRTPSAITTIFVTRDGRVGLWLQRCPLCGCGHVHTICPFHDIRIAFAAAGGFRCSHCQLGPNYIPGAESARDYQLVWDNGPALFAPGASRSRAAKNAMRRLRALGIETLNEEIPSSLWVWR